MFFAKSMLCVVIFMLVFPHYVEMVSFHSGSFEADLGGRDHPIKLDFSVKIFKIDRLF